MSSTHMLSSTAQKWQQAVATQWQSCADVAADLSQALNPPRAATVQRPCLGCQQLRKLHSTKQAHRVLDRNKERPYHKRPHHAMDIHTKAGLCRTHALAASVKRSNPLLHRDYACLCSSITGPTIPAPMVSLLCVPLLLA
jgi:hypothetical protein